MLIDSLSQKYFEGKVKQVFVYLTNRCQLKCAHCLYKPLLSNDSDDFDFLTLTRLLEKFNSFGAYKISFLGGEPTLYHDHKTGKKIGELIDNCIEIGYQYIRVDTNGQFEYSFLENPSIKNLSEITFSLDGHCAEINDVIRGSGTFQKCINSIKFAVSLGYNVQITSCIHKYTCPDEEIGVANVNKMILFAQELGVNSINFHPILKVGVERDQWIDNTNIDSLIWLKIYNRIYENIELGRYSINVRMPMRFVESKKFVQNPETYNYCPLEMAERALIMPNGQIKVCAFTIGTPYCVSNYTNNEISFAPENNEIFKLNHDNKGLCCEQKTSDGLVPLCMSYKPNQNEMVWNDINVLKGSSEIC